MRSASFRSTRDGRTGRFEASSAVSRIRSQEEQNGSDIAVDEPDLARAVGKAEPPCGRRRLGRDLHERPALLDQRADLAARQHVVLAPALVGVERHELDEADDVGLPPGELGERRDLRLREAPHRDAVDLDRAQLGVPLGLGESHEDAVERVAARDLGETDVRQRVERDVDLGGGRRRRAAPRAGRAGRRSSSGEVADAVEPRELVHQHGQLAANERLTAREAHLAHAHRGEQPDQPFDLLEASTWSRGNVEPFGARRSSGTGSCTCP